jgi:hypothetical protein
MKIASALKYGGELVEAEECDYDSFKQLIPLCPCCKEPVFLRVGGERLSKLGNTYTVGSHWAHFQGKTPEQVANCENRVNGFTAEDKQRIASKARGQRLKLLQRKFWSIAVKCHTEYLNKLQNEGRLDVSGVESRLLLGDEWAKRKSTFVSAAFAILTHDYKNMWMSEEELISCYFEAWSNGKRPVILGSKTSNLSLSAIDLVDKASLTLESIADWRLHQQITGEVISFLGSRTGVAIYAELLASEMHESLLACNSGGIIKGVIDTNGKGLFHITPEGYCNLFRMAQCNTVLLLCSIPWADVLSSEQESKVLAAVH